MSRTTTSTPVSTSAARSGADRISTIWGQLPAADRVVLLGHDRLELTSAEKVRLARLARAVVIAGRDPEPRPLRRTSDAAAARRGRRGRRRAT